MAKAVNGRPRGSLELYVATVARHPDLIRLIAARTFAQAESMVRAGWTVKVCGKFQAYRLGKVGVELEYYYPQKGVIA